MELLGLLSDINLAFEDYQVGRTNKATTITALNNIASRAYNGSLDSDQRFEILQTINLIEGSLDD